MKPSESPQNQRMNVNCLVSSLAEKLVQHLSAGLSFVLVNSIAGQCVVSPFATHDWNVQCSFCLASTLPHATLMFSWYGHRFGSVLLVSRGTSIAPNTYMAASVKGAHFDCG